LRFCSGTSAAIASAYLFFFKQLSCFNATYNNWYTQLSCDRLAPLQLSIMSMRRLSRVVLKNMCRF